jgi:hypothetical protein
VLLKGIGDLAVSWRIKGSSSMYCLKSSQLDYLVYIIYPMFLFAVTCTQLIYVESYSPLCMCWYMLCYLLVLFWVIKYVLVGFHTMYVCLCLSLCCILFYIIWLFWETNRLSHFWGSDMLWHFTILNMCAHEEYHLVLIFEIL